MLNRRLRYIYGANDHPVSIDGHKVYWDGDQILLTLSRSGTLEDIKAGYLADISSSSGYQSVVWDRDASGNAIGYHDASGYSAWMPSIQGHSCGPVLPLPSSGPGAIPANAPPASANFDNAFYPPIVEPRTDGYYDGDVVIQGARTYDPQTSSWTTPDAYAGELHEPMSQKPYVWNGNNAVDYQDPSGFCFEDACVGETVLVLAIFRLAQAAQPALAEFVESLGGGGGSAIARSAGKGATAVYRSLDEVGTVQYVGITNNLARREAEHMRTRAFRTEAVMHGLTRSDARAVEQALIEIHGLSKNGGSLLNLINSIAKSNPTYAAQLTRGLDLLTAAGYPR